jgi:opacity protein-like surface antigen
MARVLALVSILVLAGAWAAAAEEAVDYGRTGVYVEATASGAGYRGIDKEVQQRLGAQGLTTTGFNDTSAALGARVGYRLIPHLAAEIQYEWVSNSNVDVSGDLEQNDLLDVTSWAVTTNIKGYLLPNSRIQPFLLAGVGLFTVDATENIPLDLRNDKRGFALRMGGGVDVYLTPSVAVVFDVNYLVPTGGVAPFDYLTGGIGVEYRF